MKFWQVDAFSSEIFKGNPAAVLVLDRKVDDKIKQNIAMEMAVSETAFVEMLDSQMNIQWFTPNSEVNLCGHATLSAAHILWEQDFVNCDSIVFESKSGKLGVEKSQGGYELDFPKQGGVEKPQYVDLIKEILGGISPTYISSNTEDCLAVIEDSNQLRSIKPNFDKIKLLNERGFLLTAHDESKQFDYLYRGFFPKLDIPEDPVTGSANTILAPYWSEKLIKQSLKAHQASKRGGDLGLRVIKDRVLISGKAVTTISGEIHL